jgi:hypothetical protein
MCPPLTARTCKNCSTLWPGFTPTKSTWAVDCPAT